MITIKIASMMLAGGSSALIGWGQRKIAPMKDKMSGRYFRMALM